jgi:hypothetical protein
MPAGAYPSRLLPNAKLYRSGKNALDCHSRTGSVSRMCPDQDTCHACRAGSQTSCGTVCIG